MLAWADLFENRVHAALDGCRAAVQSAVAVGNPRAEAMIRCAVLGNLLYEVGDNEQARRELELGVQQARAIGARRFEAQALTALALVLQRAGESGKAYAAAAEGVAAANSGALHFSGPWALAVMAHVCDDSSEAQRLLGEGEALLARADISHNHLYFRRLAIDICIRDGAPAEAERHTRALQRYTEVEPLPWSSLFVARAGAMIAMARGCGRPDVVAHVRRQAVSHGFVVAASALVN
jgi:hypothetical protein